MTESVCQILELKLLAILLYYLGRKCRNSAIKKQKSQSSYLENKYLFKAFTKNSKHILKLFRGDTYKINERNCCFSLNVTFIGLEGAHDSRTDVTPSKVALADYNGLIQKGTTFMQTLLLQATPK